jgi:hypothetical protein
MRSMVEGAQAVTKILWHQEKRRCKRPSHRTSCGPPLYLRIAEDVRWKRLSALAGGHRPKHAAMSPVPPQASTVGEPGIFAVVTHDRTVAGSQSHEQGRLP